MCFFGLSSIRVFEPWSSLFWLKNKKKKTSFSPFVVSAALCINGRCLNYLGKWNLIILPALGIKVPFNFWRCPPGEWLVSLMNLAHSKSSQRGSSVLVSGATVFKVTCWVVILTVPSSFISVAAVDFHKLCTVTQLHGDFLQVLLLR